ncbi:unnamed protein product, partial [Candidula unifasciata]
RLRTINYLGRTEFKFEVESPPQGRGCIVSPMTGEALTTKFTVECVGYVDYVSRLPLTYKLYQRDNVGMSNEINTLVAYSGTNVLDKITLSARGVAGVSIIHLFVEVKNVKGTTSTAHFSVQV